MVWSNLTVGSHYIHNVSNSYDIVVNVIATFVEPTLTTNIATNDIIQTQYSIKRELKVFWKKGEAAVRK